MLSLTWHGHVILIYSKNIHVRFLELNNIIINNKIVITLAIFFCLIKFTVIC